MLRSGRHYDGISGSFQELSWQTAFIEKNDLLFTFGMINVAQMIGEFQKS